MAGVDMMESKRKKAEKPKTNEGHPLEFIGGYVTSEQKRRLAIAAELNGVSVTRLLALMIDGLTVSVNANK
jgi:hypothetical protein